MDGDLGVRFDKAVLRQAQQQRTPPKKGSRRRWGTVVSTDNGPPPTVTVDIAGTHVGPLSYLDTGVPLDVDDYVFMENVDGNTVVMGHVTQTSGVEQAPLFLRRNVQLVNYTLVLTDQLGVVVEIASAVARNVTVPPVSAVAWTEGAVIGFATSGVGQVSMVAGAGVTFHSRGNIFRSAGRYAEWAARYEGDDVWWLSGDLTT